MDYSTLNFKDSPFAKDENGSFIRNKWGMCSTNYEIVGRHAQLTSNKRDMWELAILMLEAQKRKTSILFTLVKYEFDEDDVNSEFVADMWSKYKFYEDRSVALAVLYNECLKKVKESVYLKSEIKALLELDKLFNFSEQEISSEKRRNQYTTGEIGKMYSDFINVYCDEEKQEFFEDVFKYLGGITEDLEVDIDGTDEDYNAYVFRVVDDRVI